MRAVHDPCTAGGNGEGEMNREQKLEAALRTILDAIDYTVGNCGLTEMVAATLPVQLITQAKEALKKP